MHFARLAVGLVGDINDNAVQDVLVPRTGFVRSIPDAQHAHLFVFKLYFVMTRIGDGRIELGGWHGWTRRRVLQLDFGDLNDVVGRVLDLVAGAGRTPAHISSLERDLFGFASARDRQLAGAQVNQHAI